jgi:hypothetical protein
MSINAEEEGRHFSDSLGAAATLRGAALNSMAVLETSRKCLNRLGVTISRLRLTGGAEVH